MLARIKNEITLWRVIVAIIFLTGIYATYIRFFEGFRASTNLSDGMPWGLWVGLGTLCGIGLSAAGFGISRGRLSSRMTSCSSCRMTKRLIMFSSSRTFPGHS